MMKKALGCDGLWDGRRIFRKRFGRILSEVEDFIQGDPEG